MSPRESKALEALYWFDSLFDDEGNFREEYQDQVATALEKLDQALAAYDAPKLRGVKMDGLRGNQGG